jgi:tripartite-type tricarboxylate transporter receptor subunit TctC
MHSKKFSARALLMSIVTVALLASQATPAAEPERDLAKHFRQRVVTVIVGSAPGGSYDFFSRMLAIYGSQYLPGKPNIIVQNRTGGGGARALRAVYERPRDGLTIGTMSPTLTQKVVLGSDLGVPGFDLAAQKWVGGTLNLEATGMVASRTAVASNWEGVLALDRKLIVGASTPGGRNTIGADFLALLGGPIQMVYGYGGNAEIFPALDRGELEGIGVGRAVPRLFPDWAKTKFISFLYYWGPHPSKDPDMSALLKSYGAKAPPHISEVWKISKEHLTVLNISVGLSNVASNAYYLPPGVPDDVYQAWVKVFERMVENPEYRRISANAGYTVNLATPKDIENVLQLARQLSPEDLKFYRTLAIKGAQ